MARNKTTAVDLFDVWMEHSEYKEMHRHDFHEIFLNLEGSGEQYTSEGTIKMKKGDVFFFPAGIEHIGNGGPSGNCLGGVININEKLFLGDSIYSESGEVFKSLTRNAKEGHYKINISNVGRKQLLLIFQNMLEEIRVKKAGYRSIVNSFMHQFLIVILRNSQLNFHIKSTDTSITVDKINDTIQFLKTHFFDQIDIDHAAQMSNMSRSYFHANFKKVTGKTYIEFLNDLRIKSADKLFKTTELDTNTIAFRSGFTSVSHFYKVFKETTGNTPKKLIRKRILKDSNL
jgi:AraC-like DNA-binding protein